MSKSIWMSLVCGIIGIAIAVWIYFSPSNEQKILPPSVPPKAANIRVLTITPEDEKFIEAMKKSEEEAEKNKEATIAGIEFFNEATRTKDVTVCKKIEIDEMKQNCENQVTSSLASEKKDPLICETLSGTSGDTCRNNVYFSSAMSEISLSGSTKQDDETCEKITDISLKEKCKQRTESVVLEMKQSAKWELSEKDCKEFADKDVQWECQSRIVIQNDYKILSQIGESPNSGICEKMSDEILKIRCEDTALYSRAKKESDISLCEKITNTSLAEQCKKEIITLEERLIFLDATNQWDPRLCEKLTESPLKTSCFDRTRIKKIIESKDISQCDVLVDDSLRESCVASIKLQS